MFHKNEIVVKTGLISFRCKPRETVFIWNLPNTCKTCRYTFFISNWFCNLCSKLFLYENSILWYWVTFLPGFKIMESFASGPENINVTNAVQIWSKKNGFRKTALADSASYTSRMLALFNPKWLHLYAIYLCFIPFFF